MNNLDDQIRNALQSQQKELFNDDEEQLAHIESLKAMFHGTTKWFSILHLLIMAVFITMIVVCAVQFFQVESTRAMIAWATGFIVFVTLEAITELYFMIEMNKYVIRWEVKQLELQVASMASEMRGESGSDAGGE